LKNDAQGEEELESVNGISSTLISPALHFQQEIPNALPHKTNAKRTGNAVVNVSRQRPFCGWKILEIKRKSIPISSHKLTGCQKTTRDITTRDITGLTV
jgi:hypothetical protein